MNETPSEPRNEPTARPKPRSGYDPFCEGFAAAAVGKPLAANPYEPGSEAFGLWTAGHRDHDQPADDVCPEKGSG
jgi:hypothetical protein